MPFVSDFFSKLPKKNFKYQILVVINGTTDNTEEVVKKYQKKYKTIKYLNFKRGGKGFAVKEGFKSSLKENFGMIGFVDADMATPPEEFFKLASLVGKSDGAICDRYKRESKIVPSFSFRRTMVSRVFNFLVRSLFFVPYKDTQCGAKVFKSHVIERIISESTMSQWAFDIDFLHSCHKNNFKILSVPTVWYEREGSKLNLMSTSVGMLFAIVQLRILKSPFKRFFKILKYPIGILYKLVK